MNNSIQSKSEYNTLTANFWGWGRLLFLMLLLFVFKQAQGQNITHIYTDFNGGWSSGLGDLNNIATNEDSHLLGFTVDGVTYSTGVDDALLETLHGSNNFTAATYNALPVESLVAASSGTFIGIPYMWNGTAQLGGGNNTGFQTLPEEQVPYYVNQGTQGLNLGTAVFNIASGSEAVYPIETVNIDATTAPAIIVTQMGDPSPVGTADTFRFVDSEGETIGNPVSVIMNLPGYGKSGILPIMPQKH